VNDTDLVNCCSRDDWTHYGLMPYAQVPLPDGLDCVHPEKQPSETGSTLMHRFTRSLRHKRSEETHVDPFNLKYEGERPVSASDADYNAGGGISFRRQDESEARRHAHLELGLSGQQALHVTGLKYQQGGGFCFIHEERVEAERIRRLEAELQDRQSERDACSLDGFTHAPRTIQAANL
jgi:hypothetical protein